MSLVAANGGKLAQIDVIAKDSRGVDNNAAAVSDVKTISHMALRVDVQSLLFREMSVHDFEQRVRPTAIRGHAQTQTKCEQTANKCVASNFWPGRHGSLVAQIVAAHKLPAIGIATRNGNDNIGAAILISFVIHNVSLLLREVRYRHMVGRR